MPGEPREADVIATDHAHFTRRCGRVHAAMGLDEAMQLRALALLSLLAASTARADPIELVPTCVAIDEGDALGPVERAQASQMMTRVLEQQDLLVVDSGCVVTYTLLHERAGDAMIAHVRGPGGGRKLHVTGMAGLPAAYERMVRALREPPTPTTPPTPTPTPDVAPSVALAPQPDMAQPFPTEPAIVAPVEEPPTTPYSHNVFYAALGIGGMGGAGAPHSVALGYRHDGAATVFDGAVTWFSSPSGGTESVTGTRVAGKLLRELAPASATSLYIGGGLGVSGSTIQLPNSAYSGRGLEGVATAGVDFLRDRRGARMFVQADVILPFYVMQSDMTGETEYAGTVMLSFGFGLGGR